MKTFSFLSPPTTPGIYALRHDPTGRIYIGQSADLRRRFAEWKGALVTGLGSKNAHVAGPAHEWTFCILAELPGSSADELNRREAHAINRALDKSPHLLLNVVFPSPLPKSTGGRPLTTITHAGNSITYQKAAQELGVTSHSLAKRLQKIRKKGRSEITLEELQKLSKKYRVPETKMLPT